MADLAEPLPGIIEATLTGLPKTGQGPHHFTYQLAQRSGRDTPTRLFAIQLVRIQTPNLAGIRKIEFATNRPSQPAS